MTWILISLCLVGFFWQVCPCCCGLCSDNFNRADNSDIDTGSDCGWTEVAGDWAILGNALTIISTQNSLALSDTSPPDFWLDLTVTATSSNTDDEVMIVVARVSSSSYRYVKWKVSATTGRLSIGFGNGTTHTEQDGLPLNVTPGTAKIIKVCVRETLINARIDATEVFAGGVNSAVGWGLGTGNVHNGSTTFEDLSAGNSSPETCDCSLHRNCLVCADNFDRDNDTNIATDSTCLWTEEAGAWEINTNKLRSTGSGHRVALSGVDASDPQVNIYCYPQGGPTGTARIVFNYTDVSNYLCAEVDFSASSPRMRIISRAGGTDTTLDIVTITLPSGSVVGSLAVCTRDSGGGRQIYCEWRHGSLIYGLTVSGEPMTSSKWGLAATGSNVVIFDNVACIRAEHAVCLCIPPECVNCLDDPPAQIQAEFAGVANASCQLCNTFNNTFILNYIGECFWSGVIPELCTFQRVARIVVFAHQQANGKYLVRVEFNHGTFFKQWVTAEQVAKIDCDFAALDVPIDGNTACQFGGAATLELTAI